MRVIALYWLLLICSTTFAYCWMAGWRRFRRGSRQGCLVCIAGCLAAITTGATLPAVLGAQTNLPMLMYAVLVFAYGVGFLRHALIWQKRRLVRRGKSLSPFWAGVDDYYFGRKADPDSPVELISSAAPAGRGTEPEASPAPAGRGSELEPVAEATVEARDAKRERSRMRE